MKMKRNVTQKIKPTRRLILMAGIFSILGVTAIWFVFYFISGTDKSLAGKSEKINTTAYVEDENLIDFEVKEARIRPADDPVAKGIVRHKEVRVLENQ